jgi:hypothetical protein
MDYLVKKDYNFTITDSPPLSVIQQSQGVPTTSTNSKLFKGKSKGMNKRISLKDSLMNWNEIKDCFMSHLF